MRNSRKVSQDDLSQYATYWDLISAKYIDFISNTHLGNLVRDTHEAIQLLTETEDQHRNKERLRQEGQRMQRARKEGKNSPPQSNKVIEEPPKPIQGYRADDNLDLIPVQRTFPNSNRTLHSDLENAPIRRLDELFPTESNKCVNGYLAP